MFSVLAFAVQAAHRSMPVTEALSGIFGSISLTAWICLLVSFSEVTHAQIGWTQG